MASKHVPLNQTPEYDTHRWCIDFHSSCHLNISFFVERTPWCRQPQCSTWWAWHVLGRGTTRLWQAHLLKHSSTNDPRLWLTCLRGVCDSAPRWVISGSKKLLTRLIVFIVFWLPFSNIVQCSLENATQEDHVWSGLALSLACEGRHLRALVLLKEVRIGFALR